MIKSTILNAIISSLLKREMNFTATNVDTKVEIPTGTDSIVIYFKADNVTMWAEKEEKE